MLKSKNIWKIRRVHPAAFKAKVDTYATSLVLNPASFARVGTF